MRLDAQTALDWIRERRDEINSLERLRGQSKGDEWHKKFDLLSAEIDRFFKAIRTKRLELLGEEIDLATEPVRRIEVGPD